MIVWYWCASAVMIVRYWCASAVIAEYITVNKMLNFFVYSSSWHHSDIAEQKVSRWAVPTPTSLSKEGSSFSFWTLSPLIHHETQRFKHGQGKYKRLANSSILRVCIAREHSVALVSSIIRRCLRAFCGVTNAKLSLTYKKMVNLKQNFFSQFYCFWWFFLKFPGGENCICHSLYCY